MTENSNDETQEKEYRLVLIGKSGDGKSSFGNTLCGRKAFSTDPNTLSHTKRCSSADRLFDDKTLIIFDTPGLFDTNVDHEITKKEISKAVTKLAAPGPHAFLIVLQTGRFTDEQQQTVQRIKDMFGEEAGRYCILIITREDDLKYHETTLEKYIEKSTAPFKNLYAQCHNRCLAVDNRAGRDECEGKLRQLINIVENMLHENQSPFYTNDMFKQAEDDFRKKTEVVLAQAKAQMDEQKAAMRDDLRRQYEEESKNRLIDMEKQLRRYQRENYDDDKLLTKRELFNFASTLTKAVGDIVVKAIDHQDRNNLLKHITSSNEREMASAANLSRISPFVTYSTERKALGWSPSSDSTERNSINSATQDETADISLKNHDA